MLEMGQPLHAFDYDRLRGGRIVVRRPRTGERITLLDGSDQQLGPDHLLIADAELGLALAGVMGGADSEVAPQTTNVLLEAANFSGANTRRTASALKQRTEASLRFEKGLNPELAALASARAMCLLLETAGGVADAGIVDTYPGRRPAAPRAADVAAATADRRHGAADRNRALDPERARLPHAVEAAVAPTSSKCRRGAPTSPCPTTSWRRSAASTATTTCPAWDCRGRCRSPASTAGCLVRESVRDALAASRLQRGHHLRGDQRRGARRRPGRILGRTQPATTPCPCLNPMSSQYARMRTSLRPGVLACYAANARGRARAAGPLQLFEAGQGLPAPARRPAPRAPRRRAGDRRRASRLRPRRRTPRPRTSTTPRPSSTRSRRPCACPSTTRPPAHPTSALAARRQRPRSASRRGPGSGVA